MSDTEDALGEARAEGGDDGAASPPAREQGAACSRPENEPPAPRTGPDELFRPVTAPEDAAHESISLVRPYAWTRGRTESSLPLEVETMVSSEGGYGPGRAMGLEHRSIAELCRHPHSVAEVAAKLSVPLGVARVLLSDMAELGLIKVHQTIADDDMATHLVLMERVLRGLRRL